MTLSFISTNKFETSEYFTAKNEQGQIVAQVIRTMRPPATDSFWGYRMLKPGVGGKAQANHLRRFGPFNSFDEAQKAIEADFAEPDIN